MSSTDEAPLGVSHGEQTTASPPPPLRRNHSSLRLLTELTRERIALRYLHAWTELYKPEFIDRNAFPDTSTIPAPAACLDSGLAAFAQLAALRIGVRRAFVTIMSRETEYILVEATRTMSLQSDFTADAKDKSWLGTCCITRTDGINDTAVDKWRKARSYRNIPANDDYYYTEGTSPHWCIVSDAGLNPSVKDRSLIARAQSPRFFFSIPLRDAEGTVIGSLSMLDDKPRYGVSAHEMLFCEDLSDTIAQHIFGSMVATQRQRSERLIQALGTFNSGGKSLRDWWIGQDNLSMQRGGRRRDVVHDADEKNERFKHEFGAEEDTVNSSRQGSRSSVERAPLSSITNNQSRTPRSATDGNTQATQNRLDNHVSGQDFSGASAQPPRGDSESSVLPYRGLKAHQASSQRRKANDTSKATQDFDSAAEIKNVYSRASTLLRESTGAAGVVFMDASAASTIRPQNATAFDSKSAKGDSTSSSGTTTTSPSASSDDSRMRMTSDTDLSESEPRSRPCKVIGASTQMQARDANVRAAPLRIIERDLAKLIKSYPSGKVFNYAASGTPYSGSDDSAGSGGASSESAPGETSKSLRANTRHNRHARLLRKVVGDARSIAFYPIWDTTNKKYRSCLFAWTLHANRFFDIKEDMTYLSAFGHSLRAEISRIETVSSDIAKSKFISSVSHELRSPLHGILAGVELLQDTQLTPFQEEMSLSVALAGRTLLDTVNHILDYSKISNLTGDQKRDRARVDAARHKSAQVDDSEKSLLTLVDLARITEDVVETVVSASRFSKSFDRSNAVSRNKSHAPQDGDLVSVILDIKKRDSWATAMTPGSWTRVLTNIVGNALKYTPSGLITIKLFSQEDPANGMSHVTLQVEDTGIGMSQDFISNDLFVPFRQADSHSAGTGLGLSIVKQVVKEFKGSVNVDSEIGKGSRVSVRFVARFTETPDAVDDDPKGPLNSRVKQICMLQMSKYLDRPLSSITQSVADSVQQIASQWYGCEISSTQGSAPMSQGRLCVISEDELSLLNTLHDNGAKNLIETLAESGSSLLVFGRSIASSQPEFDFQGFSRQPIYMHQPIGPRKLQRVLQYARSSTVTRQHSDYRADYSHFREPLPITIEGGSYFDLPQDPKLRAQSSLITPTSFMDASSIKTPEAYMPTDRSAERPAEESTSDTEQPGGDVVLLVEDNAINMRLLVALMKKQGLSYDSAEDGLQALNKFTENPGRYFLILMDMNMPVMDGFESTAKIRAFERKNDLLATNIAALTGVTSEEARNSAYDAGVNKYLTKPIQMKDLTKLVSETREGKLNRANQPVGYDI